jgi:hypothetical protein
MSSRWLPSTRWIVAVDALVIAWIAAWLFMGMRVHDEVEGLTELSATISRAGGAVEETGHALDELNVPFVGDRIDEAATRVVKVGRDTRLSGRTARDSISDLSTLLGVSVALIPLSPILFVYVPVRLGRIRDRRARRKPLEPARASDGQGR